MSLGADAVILKPSCLADLPLTVAIPQCWGHAKAEGLPHAQKHPGVNVNLLAGDGHDNIEKLSGMSHLSGIPVDVRRADDQRSLPFS